MQNCRYIIVNNLINGFVLFQVVLGIIHNCVRHFPENSYLVREDNGLDLLTKYRKSTFLIIKAKVIIVLAYCVNEEENDKLVTGKYYIVP